MTEKKASSSEELEAQICFAGPIIFPELTEEDMAQSGDVTIMTGSITVEDA